MISLELIRSLFPQSPEEKTLDSILVEESLSHPLLRERLQEFLQVTAAEHQRIKLIREKARRWIVQVGTHSTTAALLAEYEAKGIPLRKYDWENLLETISVAKISASLELLEIGSDLFETYFNTSLSGLTECKIKKIAERHGLIPAPDEIALQMPLQHYNVISREGSYRVGLNYTPEKGRSSDYSINFSRDGSEVRCSVRRSGFDQWYNGESLLLIDTLQP